MDFKHNAFPRKPDPEQEPERFVTDAYKHRIMQLDLAELQDEKLKLMPDVYRWGFVSARIAQLIDDEVADERRLELEQDGRE